MTVLDPVRVGIMRMSDVVLMVTPMTVHPGDPVVVAHHRSVKMLERVRVPIRFRINQEQSRKHQYGQDELTRSTLISLIKFSQMKRGW